MDQLRLNGIEVECIIGDLPEERENEQRLLVDVALDSDLEDAADSDRLDDTVDYALLVGNIREALEARGERDRGRAQVRQRARPWQRGSQDDEEVIPRPAIHFSSSARKRRLDSAST